MFWVVVLCFVVFCCVVVVFCDCLVCVDWCWGCWCLLCGVVCVWVFLWCGVWVCVVGVFKEFLVGGALENKMYNYYECWLWVCLRERLVMFFLDGLYFLVFLWNDCFWLNVFLTGSSFVSASRTARTRSAFSGKYMFVMWLVVFVCVVWLMWWR